MTSGTSHYLPVKGGGGGGQLEDFGCTTMK